MNEIEMGPKSMHCSSIHKFFVKPRRGCYLSVLLSNVSARYEALSYFSIFLLLSFRLHFTYYIVAMDLERTALADSASAAFIVRALLRRASPSVVFNVGRTRLGMGTAYRTLQNSAALVTLQCNARPSPLLSTASSAYQAFIALCLCHMACIYRNCIIYVKLNGKPDDCIGMRVFILKT